MSQPSSEREEWSDVVISKGPCVDCGSSDNLVTYADGHSFCFGSCSELKSRPDGSEPSAKPSTPSSPRGLLKPGSGAFDDLKSRNLKQDTLQRYGYFRAGYSGDTVHVAPYYSQRGTLVQQKLRGPNKRFTVVKGEDVEGGLGDCQLFGQHVFGEKFDKKVVVTEGELDAMSVGQATQFKLAAVSIPSGIAQAAKALKANYRWLDRFEEIILWFDDDEVGQAAIQECAELFQVGKVKTIRVDGFKDASDVLQANRPGDIMAAVWAAVGWRPQGIVNASQCASDFETEDDEEVIGSWPWKGMQAVTLGMRLSEVTYHVAGTGIGKTLIQSEVQHHLRHHHPKAKLGILRFEDTRKKAQLDLMSIEAGRRLHIEPLPREETLALHTAVFGGGMVELFDPTTAEWTMEAILGYIRYMAKALDVVVFFIDPLSFLVAAMDVSADERKALDQVSMQLAKLAKELGICIHVTHHLTRPEKGPSHEEGAPISLKHIRGSGGIAMFSSGVFGYERNQQGERPDLLRVRNLKNRHEGSTGICQRLRFERDTGRLVETDERWPEEEEGGGMPSFGTSQQDSEY